MLDLVWSLMLLVGFAVAALNGRLDATTTAALNGAGEAVSMCIGLLGIMCLWCGLMNLAEKAGLVRFLSKLLGPLLSRLFPDVPKDSPAMGAMVMNMAANMLGLSNAATPLGLNAMNELKKLHPGDTASNAMVLFVVINTASITLIPTTVIALRAANASKNPTEIIAPVWIAGVLALFAGLCAAKFFEGRRKGK